MVTNIPAIAFVQGEHAASIGGFFEIFLVSLENVHGGLDRGGRLGVFLGNGTADGNIKLSADLLLRIVLI